MDVDQGQLHQAGKPVTAFAVFLVVTISWPDAEPWTETTEWPTVEACMLHAAYALNRAAEVHSEEPYRVSAKCTLEWPGHDPA